MSFTWELEQKGVRWAGNREGGGNLRSPPGLKGDKENLWDQITIGCTSQTGVVRQNRKGVKKGGRGRQ